MRFILASFFLLFNLGSNAEAHIKWFASYDIICPPRAPVSILSDPWFLQISFLSIVTMTFVLFIDNIVSSTERVKHYAAILHKATLPLYSYILRFGLSAFCLVSAAFDPNMILTPELKVDGMFPVWISVALHILIAFTAIFKRTSNIAGVGVAALYAVCIYLYGIFHMLDYPIFLGIAGYLWLEGYGAQGEHVGRNVLRASAGVTLLWAAIEKFAYPEWTSALFASMPSIHFGINDFGLYITGAGFVEFCLAYLLIKGRIASQVASICLMFMFILAIGPFGIVDAIGHSCIIIVLILLTCTKNEIKGIQQLSRVPILIQEIFSVQILQFAITLLLFIFSYSVMHFINYA
jgi:hypothetical protein